MASQTKKIAFDTAALLSGKAIGLILGIVRLNYLTTYLGVEGFGILNFALYFSSLFQVLFDIGVAQTTIREIAVCSPAPYCAACIRANAGSREIVKNSIDK